MKALAWYSVIFNILIIILLILTGTKVVEPPPFSMYEVVFWVATIIPVLVLGIRVLREPK